MLDDHCIDKILFVDIVINKYIRFVWDKGKKKNRPNKPENKDSKNT